MLIKRELEDGKVLVTSSDGLVDIGSGAVKCIIVTAEEVDYITEAATNTSQD